MAIVNAQQAWVLPDGSRIELLDYQVPLKAKRADREIGKIDMFGLTEHGRAVVLELKVIGHSGGPSDPPPVALLEGLRYAAIVEANLEKLAKELRDRFGREMLDEKPDIVILGEADWWYHWMNANVRAALELKARELSLALGVGIVFASVPNNRIHYGHRTQAPRLVELPKFEYNDTLPKSTLKTQNHRADKPVHYEDMLQECWWNYAKELGEDDLDGFERQGRPPVVSAEKPHINLILPSNERQASEIKAEIAGTDRHKHFGSFRSSQALAQSVFAAFKAAGRLDLLSHVRAECGRPAFGKTTQHTMLSMEVDVSTLNEPRPTQLDACLETSGYQVAIECKFCEVGFGTCSRVRSENTLEPLCDGTYTQQQGRRTRCALSEIGVSYWSFIPQVFEWDAAQDLSPCPLLPTYQIVRNALAAVVDSSGELNAARGHAVIVYDARNPSYRIGGAADEQLRKAVSACLIPGLIRRVSWQEIVRVCSRSTEMSWLPEAMNEKHGIRPNQ